MLCNSGDNYNLLFAHIVVANSSVLPSIPESPSEPTVLPRDKSRDKSMDKAAQLPERVVVRPERRARSRGPRVNKNSTAQMLGAPCSAGPEPEDSQLLEKEAETNQGLEKTMSLQVKRDFNLK